MSIESVARALHIEGLNPAEKLVLIGVANHDGDGGSWPSIATLSKYACVGERRVQQILDDLQTWGYLTRCIQEGGNAKTRPDRRPNLYAFHPERGMKPIAPRDDDGVKSETSRGETQRAHGVKPIAPEPSSNHPEPSPSSHDEDTINGFANFWKSYPRKVGKTEARTAYLKAVRKVGAHVLVSAALRENERWKQAPPSERKFFKHPATWLNKGCWEDEIDPPAEVQTYDAEEVRKFCRQYASGVTDERVRQIVQAMAQDGYGAGETLIRLAIYVYRHDPVWLTTTGLKNVGIERFEGMPKAWEDDPGTLFQNMERAARNGRWSQK